MEYVRISPAEYTKLGGGVAAANQITRNVS